MKNNMKKMVISLDKDISRRALFFAQPHTEDIEIFSAINMMEKEKQETAWHFDPTLFLQHYQRWATRGEIGCVLSHLSVYQKLVEDPSITNDDYCLICEDDAQFCSDFSIQLASILSLPLSADIVLLGQSKIASFNSIELEINYPTTLTWLRRKCGRVAIGYPYRNYFAGTVAYLIKKSAATRLVEYCKQYPLYWLADDFILYEKKFGLAVQIIRPLLAIEHPDLTSNLQAERGEKKTYKLTQWLKYPIKKLLAIKRNLEK